MPNDYRTRFYGTYLSGRKTSIEPNKLEDLRPRLPYLNKLIQNHFPRDKNASILDLGCGHGALIYIAQQRGYRNVKGIDISPEQVAAAKKLHMNGIKQGDIMEALAEVPDGELDCLVTFDLIEHFNITELISLVNEGRRVLGPQGRWIIHTPNAESPFGMKMRYWDITHEIAFTRTSLTQLLLSAGFSRVECIEDQPVPHGIKSSARWLLWRAIRSLLRFYIAVETGNIDCEAIFSQNFLAVALK